MLLATITVMLLLSTKFDTGPCLCVLCILYHSLGKFTVGYFHVKIVCGKIFSSFRVADENF